MVPVQTSDPQTSDATNLRLTNVGQYKRRTRTNVGLRKKNNLNFNIFFVLKSYFRLLTGLIKKKLSSLPITQIFSSLPFQPGNGTFKLKWFDLIDFIG